MKAEIKSALFVVSLFIVFLVLKLFTNVIDWRWLWVCSPLWIYVTIIIAVMILEFITVMIEWSRGEFGGD